MSQQFNRTELKRAKTDKEKENILETYRKKGEEQSRALRESCRGKGNECHLNALAGLRNTNQAAATMINNGLLLSLSEPGRSDLSAWGLALDSNLPDLTYHEGQLSGGAKLLDTGVKLGPVAGALAGAGGSKAAQALAGRKVAVTPGNYRQPSGVDGERAGGNKPTKQNMSLFGQNAQQVPSGNFPRENQKPNTVLYRANQDGSITSYAVYDKDGMILKRVDMQGKAHAGIPTPHVIEYGRNTLPDGTVKPVTPRKSMPRPARADELYYFIKR